MNLIGNGITRSSGQLRQRLGKEIPIYIQVGEDGDLYMVGSINPHQVDPDEPAALALSKFLIQVAGALAESVRDDEPL